MNIVPTVVFDADERRLIELASVHLSAAFEQGSESLRQASSLRHAEPITLVRVEIGKARFTQLLARLRERSTDETGDFFAAGFALTAIPTIEAVLGLLNEAAARLRVAEEG